MTYSELLPGDILIIDDELRSFVIANNGKVITMLYLITTSRPINEWAASKDDIRKDTKVIRCS